MQKARRKTKPQRILEELSKCPVVLTKSQIWWLVWGEDFHEDLDANALRANLCYARRLLNGDGVIRTIWGHGYVFIPSEVQC